MYIRVVLAFWAFAYIAIAEANPVLIQANADDVSADINTFLNEIIKNVTEYRNEFNKYADTLDSTVSILVPPIDRRLADMAELVSASVKKAARDAAQLGINICDCITAANDEANDVTTVGNNYTDTIYAARDLYKTIRDESILTISRAYQSIDSLSLELKTCTADSCLQDIEPRFEQLKSNVTQIIYTAYETVLQQNEIAERVIAECTNEANNYDFTGDWIISQLHECFQLQIDN